MMKTVEKKYRITSVFITFLLLSIAISSNATDPVRLHINKTVYQSGEVMHVKGYILDKKLMEQGFDIRVALMDTQDKKSFKKTLRLKYTQLIEGISITLDKSLKQGVYQLIIFDEFYSQIYNSTSFLILNSSEDVDQSSDKLAEKMEVFVESGGHLVAGLENTMVIKDYSNRNVNRSLIIKNEQDSVVGTFSFKPSGLVKIKLNPALNKNYALELRHNNELVSSKVISARRKDGIISSVLQSIQKDIILDFNFVNTPHDGHQLLITSGQNIIGQIEINEPRFRRQFVSSDLPEGILQFSIVDTNNRVVKSRLVYNQKSGALSFTASSNKTTYRPGELIRLNIQSNKQNGMRTSANLSVSVSDVNQAKDVVSYQQNVWTPEFALLNTPVRSPEKYFDASLRENWILDDLMIASSKKLLINKPEQRNRRVLGINVSGQVLSSSTNLPPKGVILSIPVMNGFVRYTPVNSKGKFVFTGLDFEGQQKMYLNVWPPNREEAFQWTIDQDQPDMKAVPVATSLLNNDVLQELAKYNSIRYKVQKQYTVDDEEIFQDTPSNPITGIRSVDKTIKMGDYINLPNMKTVIKEVVPYTQTKKSGFKMFSTDLRKSFPGKPLILLDGAPVQDSTILKQDPIIFDRIEIVNTFKNIYRIGKAAENGIVAFYTRPGHGVEQQDAFELNLEGYYKDEITQNAVEPSSEEIPYIPASLFWKDDLKTDQEGVCIIEFRAPDYETELKLHIEGMSSDNKYGVGEKTIKISR